MDWVEFLISLSMGLCLAAAAGLRIFIPLLVSGLCIRFNLLPLQEDYFSQAQWLGSNSALFCFAGAAIFEVAAYKIPVLDNFLDFLGLPIAAIAGAILSVSFMFYFEDPLWRTIIGILAGTSTASFVHILSGATRLVSTKTTGAVANPFYAIFELLSSLFSSIFAFLAPILMLMILVITLCIVLYFIIRKTIRRRRSVLQ